MNFSNFIEYELDISLDNKPSQTVHIAQDPTGKTYCGVGSTIWDAGLVLAKYLEHQTTQHKLDLAGKRVIELGSGTGLVGISLSKMQPGCQILLTDKKELIPLLDHNIQINQAEANTTAQCLDWCQSVDSGKADLVLVSDGIWCKDLHQPLATTLAGLAGPQTRVLLCYETRNFAEEAEFFALWSKDFRFHDIKPADQHPMMQSGDDIFLFEGAVKT